MDGGGEDEDEDLDLDLVLDGRECRRLVRRPWTVKQPLGMQSQMASVVNPTPPVYTALFLMTFFEKTTTFSLTKTKDHKQVSDYSILAPLSLRLRLAPTPRVRWFLLLAFLIVLAVQFLEFLS